MYVKRVYIDGFKRLTDFDLKLKSSLNVIVGDNETGKSSVLEAIGLVLTGLYDGRIMQYSIDPYLFHAPTVDEFFTKRRKGEHMSPPGIVIEAYLENDTCDPRVAKLKGKNNKHNEDCPGLVLAVEVDDDHAEELKDYAADDSNPAVLPIEFYKVTWRSFTGNGVSARSLPFKAKMIDTSLARVYRGPNKYLAQVASDVLSEEQRRELSLAYKKLRHGFTREPGVAAINKHLETKATPVTNKKLTVQMDISSRSSWDSAITAHLDDLPYDLAGKGEQCRVQMRLAVAGDEKSRVVLIEEPENHLSHSNLNRLMDDIGNDCAGRQVIVTTHSPFVLNKLGIDNLRLLSLTGGPTALTELTPETKAYFMKLPGYDTLRLILAERSILVEGPSDELIVQRAYKDKHGRLPLEDGVDVIAVGSLAFERFLEIADLVRRHVRVVADNDGNVPALKKKYARYLGGAHPTIRICYDDDAKCRTLEPQLLKANSREVLNGILGKNYPTDDALLKYMERHKTDCALKMLDAHHEWKHPKYIADAIE
jgi:predicted ATP-dependent endonuclease of OLD family